MTKKDFLERLKIHSKKTSAEWLSELEDRKLRELEFHNQDRDQNIVSNLPSHAYEKLHGNKKFYRTVKLSTNYVDAWIKQNSPSKIFLDYACGNGGNAIKAARAGADLSIGLDISDVSIRNASLSAEESGVSRALHILFKVIVKILDFLSSV